MQIPRISSISQIARRSLSNTRGEFLYFCTFPNTNINSFQVAPAKLEGILITHPFVNEGAVCAKWDATQSTEVPIAYITLTKAGENCEGGLDVALHEIRKFVDGKVSPYKRLRGGVEVLDEIPKTPMGKALRRLLPARLARARPAKL